MIYCVTLFIISLPFLHHLIYLFSYFICSHQIKPCTGRSLTYIHEKTPIPIYLQNIVSLIYQKQLQPKHMFKLVNIKKTLNLNIVSYFINILASPDGSTRNTIGGPITKTTNSIGLTKNHLRTVEIPWHMVHRKKYHKALCSTLAFNYFGWT